MLGQAADDLVGQRLLHAVRRYPALLHRVVRVHAHETRPQPHARRGVALAPPLNLSSHDHLACSSTHLSRPISLPPQASLHPAVQLAIVRRLRPVELSSNRSTRCTCISSRGHPVHPSVGAVIRGGSLDVAQRAYTLGMDAGYACVCCADRCSAARAVRRRGAMRFYLHASLDDYLCIAAPRVQ